MNSTGGRRRGLLIAVLLATVSTFAASPAATSPPEQPSALIAAVKAGDLASIQQVLAKGADVNARDSQGMTALHYAAYRGDIRAAAILARAKADLNAKDVLGLTPLHAAAFEGRTELVRSLLLWGAAAGSRDAEGNTPLHYAVLLDHPEAAGALIRGGADPLAPDARGQSPAQIARAKGGGRMVALFGAAAGPTPTPESAASGGTGSGSPSGPVRTYTNEDLAELREKSRLLFQDSGPMDNGAGTAGSGEPSGPSSGQPFRSPEEIADAYARIDGLLSEKRSLESQLPSLQEQCDDFGRRERGEINGGFSKSDQGGTTVYSRPNDECLTPGSYDRYLRAVDRERNQACGPLADATNRIQQIKVESEAIRRAISSADAGPQGPVGNPPESKTE